MAILVYRSVATKHSETYGRFFWVDVKAMTNVR